MLCFTRRVAKCTFHLKITLRHRWQQKCTHSGEFVPGDEGGRNCATGKKRERETMLQFIVEHVNS